MFDVSKPDGTPRKLLDVRRLHALGWRHTTDLSEGIWLTCRWYRLQRAAGGVRGLPGVAQPAAAGQQPA